MDSIFTAFTGLKLFRLALLLAGVPAIYFLSVFLGRIFTAKYSPQAGLIFRKVFFYGLLLLILSMVMNEFGFKLNTILGAAGVAGIAIGFASQTSLSNLISGIFLIGEKHFQVGDIINVDGKTGVVDTIDLLSVKIKTFDNHYIRIPNESLIKSQLANVTKFPIRRVDFNISVAYKSDLRKVIKVLKEVAGKNEFSLEQPEPLLVIKEFGASSIDLLLGAWIKKTDFLNLKNSMIIEIKEAFDREGIEIPFPQRVVHISGDETEKLEK